MSLGACYDRPMTRRTARLLQGALCCVGMVLPACRVYGVPKYAGAAIFAGTAVAATAVNRSLTGECWAVCSPGLHCNHRSGLCEKDKEMPPRNLAWRPDTLRDAAPESAVDAAPESPGDAALTDAGRDARE